MLRRLPAPARYGLPVVLLAALIAACAAPAPTTFEDPDPAETSSAVSAGDPSLPSFCEDLGYRPLDNARQNYSLAAEFYNNEEYCAAYVYLKWLVANDPLFNGGDPDDRNFLRLANVYEAFANQSEDADTRRAYLDSALTAREQGLQELQANNIDYEQWQRDLIRGRFYDLYGNVYSETGEAEVFSSYRTAFESAPDSLDDYYLRYLVENSAFQIEQRAARADFLEEVQPYVKDEGYASYVNSVTQSLRSSAGMDPIARFRQLYQMYQGGDRSEAVVRELAVRAYQDRDTLEAEGLPAQEVFDDLLPQVVEFDPNFQTLYLLSVRARQRGNSDEAEQYFQRAVEAAPDDATRADLLYARAQRSGGGSALRLVGQALQYDPSHGPSLYLRASVIGRSVSGGSVESRAAYWCVADLFRRAAASGDPRVASAARTAASRYAASGPTRDQYFFKGWRPGQTITTSHGYGSCTTTVR